MSGYVLLLDVGGSAVKATAHGPDLHRQSTVDYPVAHPAQHRAEVDPDALRAAVLRAGAGAVAEAGAGCIGVLVCTLRQGFALLDGDGHEIGPWRPNTDRSGAPHADVHEGRYGLTGHWPAPELTLPKLLALREAWPRVRTLLFWHDWLLHRLGATPVSGVDYVCGGAMADVAARDWAHDWLESLGIPASWLPPVAEAGTQVGVLPPAPAAALGLAAGTPLHAGPGDTQLAAAGCGGLADSTVTVVAGSSSPVQLALDRPATDDPQRHPWVSTHARGLWAAEGNAGYPGTMRAAAVDLVGDVGDDADAVAPGAGGLLALVAAPYWAQHVWQRRPPRALVGWQPGTTRAQLLAAVEEAHGYAVRGNVEDLERVTGHRLDGGADRLTALGYDVHRAGWGATRRALDAYPAAATGAALLITEIEPIGTEVLDARRCTPSPPPAAPRPTWTSKHARRAACRCCTPRRETRSRSRPARCANPEVL